VPTFAVAPCKCGEPKVGADYCANCKADVHRKHRYGLSSEQYKEMLERQGGVCALCRQQCKTGNRLCVDHDHDTGKVRALLCRRCNWIAALIDEIGFDTLKENYADICG